MTTLKTVVGVNSCSSSEASPEGNKKKTIATRHKHCNEALQASAELHIQKSTSLAAAIAFVFLHLPPTSI